MSETSAHVTRSLFATGASGFIGASLLRRLPVADFARITCLARTPARVCTPGPGVANIQVIPGDLGDPASYSQALQGVDTVVHLAAATGNADAGELARINVRGTELLVRECERAGVSHLVFVSSIAVRSGDLANYPYARSKRDAEEIVRNARLNYSILRPTIVLGPGSPIWARLRQIACLPVVPLFGGGKVRVQPVDVEDIARAITRLVAYRPSESETYELGGPEALSFAELLRRIRLACGKDPRATTIPVPLWPLQQGLKLAGLLTGGKFPINAGQLTPFVSDGTAADNELQKAIRPAMRPLDTLFAELASAR